MAISPFVPLTARCRAPLTVKGSRLGLWLAKSSRSSSVRTCAKKERSQTPSKGFGKQAPAADQPPSTSNVSTEQPAQLGSLPQPSPAAAQAGVQQQPTVPASAAASAALPEATAADAVLPAVSRGRVFAACAQVSGVIAAVGLLLRAAAPLVSPAMGEGHEEAVLELLQWPSEMTAAQVGWALAAAGGVTAARAALLQVWPDFKAATDRSNQQVLSPLQPLDLLWVAALPGISEELLFRGGLIPAVYPDWRGVLIAGVTFGVLHNSGGRNPAFAAWSAAVGFIYGWLFLSMQSVYTPMLAHSVANLASAALWLSAHNSARGETQQPNK